MHQISQFSLDLIGEVSSSRPLPQAAEKPLTTSYKIVNVTQKSLYVRYIEALLCQWPTTPTRRYSEDLLARANGSVASFFKETDLACSLALAVHIVYTPNTLAIFVDPGGALGSQTIKVDLLAFLFGLNNIPNSQTGGFNVSSSSRDEAKEEFREGTNQSL